MGKIKTKSLSWTPVQLNQAILASGVEGLVGIEELTDYTIENDEIQPHSNAPITEDTEFIQEKTLSKNNKTNPTKSKLSSKSQIAKQRDQVNQKVAKNVKNVKKKIKGPLLNTISKIEQCEDSDTSSQDEEESEDEIEKSNLSPEDKSDSGEEESPETSQWTSLFVPKPVVKALLEKGFKEPTEIQVSKQ